MSSFPYPELNGPKDSIRLLRILHEAGSSSPLIICKIYSVPLVRCPPYVAVSYAWGTSMLAKDILLNETPFPIRENVWSLLTEMRQHEKLKWRFFWIDAICINQMDRKERNHQVRIMREVYATAANVLVWLGSATAHSDLAMDYVAKQDRKVAVINKAADYLLRHQRWNDLEGKAFLGLCHNRYWTRVWIVQELMLGKRIMVFCGSKSFK